MNIDHSRELLYDYARGRLSELERTIVEKQLLGSEELRQELERVKSYYAAIDEIDPVPLPEHFLENVHRRIDSRAKESLINRLLFPLHLKLPIEFAGVAATVVLVIFIFIPQLKKKNYSEYEPLPVDNVQQVQTMSQDEAPGKQVTATDKTAGLDQIHAENKIVSVNKDERPGSLMEQQPKSIVPKKLKPSTIPKAGLKMADDVSVLPAAELLSENLPPPAPASAPARQLVEENNELKKSDCAALMAPVVQENELSKAHNKSEEQRSEGKRNVEAFEQKRMKSRSAHSEKTDAKEISSSMELETTAASNDIIVLLAKYRMKLIVKDFTGHTSNCLAAGPPAAVTSFLREIKGLSDVTLLKVVPENFSAALDSVVVEFSVKGKVE